MCVCVYVQVGTYMSTCWLRVCTTEKSFVLSLSYSPFCSYSHAIRMLVCLCCTESQCHIHCWSQVGNTIESINLTSSDRFSPLKIVGECFIPNLTWHSLESSRELAQFSICLPASQPGKHPSANYSPDLFNPLSLISNQQTDIPK